MKTHHFLCRTRLVATALLISITASSQAHFIWATLDRSTQNLSLRIEERPGEETLDYGQRLLPISHLLSKGGKPYANKSTVYFPVGGNHGVALAQIDYGVYNREGKTGNLIYFAKAVSTPSDASIAVGKGFEIVATLEGNTWKVQALQDGKPAQDATIVTPDEPIEDPHNAGPTRTVALLTNAPIPLRAVRTIHLPGAKQGKHFEITRIWTTLVLPATPAVTQGSSAAAFRAVQRATELRESLPMGGSTWKLPFSATDGRAKIDGTVTWNGKDFTFSLPEDAPEARHVRSQLQSLFFHRLAGEFAQGEGQQQITDSNEPDGKLYHIHDKMNSSYRIQNDHFAEVARTVQNQRLVLRMEAFQSLPSGHYLVTNFSSRSTDTNRGAVVSQLNYADRFQEFRGDWLPLERSVEGAVEGRQITMRVKFGKPHIVGSH